MPTVDVAVDALWSTAHLSMPVSEECLSAALVLTAGSDVTVSAFATAVLDVQVGTSFSGVRWPAAQGAGRPVLHGRGGTPCVLRGPLHLRPSVALWVTAGVHDGVLSCTVHVCAGEWLHTWVCWWTA